MYPAWTQDSSERSIDHLPGKSSSVGCTYRSESGPQIPYCRGNSVDQSESTMSSGLRNVVAGQGFVIGQQMWWATGVSTSLVIASGGWQSRSIAS